LWKEDCWGNNHFKDVLKRIQPLQKPLFEELNSQRLKI